jgi:hypothetical protein
MSTLYERVYDYENLYQASILASRSKRYKPQVLKFFENLEENIITIQNELMWKMYEPGPYYYFEVRDPKPRRIVALPFKDRVVQIALCAVIEPAFESRFIYDTWACRPGKGSLAAANRLSYFLGKPDARWYLKCDIHHYFASIDIGILEEIIKRRYVQDDDILSLIDVLLRHEWRNDGIKIGNRFSQLAANAYLAELDFLLKIKGISVKYYLRYMDDFIILAPNERALQLLLPDITLFLQEKLHLSLNDKTLIAPVRSGIDFVGYTVRPRCKVVKKATLRRTRKLYRAWTRGSISGEKYLASMASRVGHAKGTNSWKFYADILLRSLRRVLVLKNSTQNSTRRNETPM